jgi:hypothetical protein
MSDYELDLVLLCLLAIAVVSLVITFSINYPILTLCLTAAYSAYLYKHLYLDKQD